MSDEHKKTVTINGVKLEVDLREATNVETYRVGDCVKVLVKEYNKYQSFPGVIVGFDDFKERPTIIVTYIKSEYGSGSLCTAYVHDESEHEICPASKGDFSLNHDEVLDILDKEVNAKVLEVEKAKAKREFFVTRFRQALEKVAL